MEKVHMDERAYQLKDKWSYVKISDTLNRKYSDLAI
jgi:hypothetical protein